MPEFAENLRELQQQDHVDHRLGELEAGDVRLGLFRVEYRLTLHPV